ncbi:MAG: zf-TFIIB domain-containing protein [Chthoniobacterales bacterium]|nr:zf-TFIIB domain-containing protein [Chthoniobacterales bacterium]
MSAPLRCPTCSRELTKTTTSHGLFWSCAACGGNALGVDVLRRTFAPDQINALWRRALTGEGSLGRACPSCSNAMIEVAATSEPQPRVDVCRLCSFVWFDTEELRSFSR